MHKTKTLIECLLVLWSLTLALLVVAPAAQAIELPDEPGKKLVLKLCSGCHSTDRIAEQTLGRDQWEEALKEMRHSGAEVTGQQRQALLAYLGTYLAPKPKGKIDVLPRAEGVDLVRAICSACHSIELVKAQRLDREEWDEVLDDMVENGAPVTKELRPIMLNYLSTHLGQDS